MPFALLLPFLKNWKLMAVGLAAISVLAIIGVVIWRVTSLIGDVATLSGERASYAAAFEEQKTATRAAVERIELQQADYNRLQATQAELQAVATEARQEARRLNELFAEHDLAALAQARPGLVERRVNDGTRAALRMLECVTAAGGRECSYKPANPAAARPAAP